MQSLTDGMDLLGSTVLLELRAAYLVSRFENHKTRDQIGGSSRIVWPGAERHYAVLKKEIARIYRQLDGFELCDTTESVAKLDTAWQNIGLLANPSFTGDREDALRAVNFAVVDAADKFGDAINNAIETNGNRAGAEEYLEVHVEPRLAELSAAYLEEAVGDLGSAHQGLVVGTGKVASDLLKLSQGSGIDLKSTWLKVVQVLKAPGLEDIRVIELLKLSVEISKIQPDLRIAVMDYLKSNHFELLMVNVPETGRSKSHGATRYKDMFPVGRFGLPGSGGLANLRRGAAPQFQQFN